MDTSAPFWQTTPMEKMTAEQWESLCDGCGLCCLHKIEDDDGDILATRISCHMLDTQSCQCKDYNNRLRHVPECLVMTPALARTIPWLPDSCAYKRLARGQRLLWWHPLISGDSTLVHEEGVSAQGRVISETYVHEDDFEFHIVDWLTYQDNTSEE